MKMSEIHSLLDAQLPQNLEQWRQFFGTVRADQWLMGGGALMCLMALPKPYNRALAAVLALTAFDKPELAFLFALFAGVWIVLRQGLLRVPEGSNRLVERLGRYHRTLRPGLHFIVPGLDAIQKPRRGSETPLFTYIEDSEDSEDSGSEVDRRKPKKHPLMDREGNISMREQMLDPVFVEAIAKDNSILHPDTLAYFRIIDPKLAFYGVDSLGDAMLKLVYTTLRQEVGKLDADELISSREHLSRRLQDALEAASDAWGVKVLRVEIQSIVFDKGIQKALSNQREQELIGRANVMAASKRKASLVLDAEGEKQAQVLRAEGEFEAKRLAAEAEFLSESKRLEGQAKGFEAMARVLQTNPQAIVALQALDAQKAVAASLGKSSNSMILPMDIAGLMGTVGALRRAWEGLPQLDSAKPGDRP